MFDKILNEFSTPFYLYNEETIIAKIKHLKELNLNFSHKINLSKKYVHLYMECTTKTKYSSSKIDYL